LTQIGVLLWAGAVVLRYYTPDIPAPTPVTAQTVPPSAASPTSPAPQDAPATQQLPTPTLEGMIAPTALPAGARPAAQVLCSPIGDVSIAGLKAIISDPYHPPPPGSDARHQGVDFAFFTNGEGNQIYKAEVHAILPGRVASVVFDRPPYGNMVLLETRPQDLPAAAAAALQITPARSLYHLYAHMDNAPAVDPQYQIRCGQFLGRVGETGASGNPHLHLETRWGPPNANFAVLAYDLTASTQIGVTEEEKQNYFYWRTSGTFEHFDPMLLFENAQTVQQAVQDDSP